VRILIWATPLLGFLGTVLGISQALGSIQLGPGSDFQQMMSALRSNLYVAFDTTALALILSIGLMFAMFLVNRLECDLLAEIDQEVREVFGKWFEPGNQSADDQVRAMHRIGRAMIAATHEMSQKQIEVWRRSIEAAQSAWLQAARNTYELLDAQLGRTLHDALSEMASQLSGTIRGLDQSLDERARQWQDRLVTVSENALSMQQQSAHNQRQTAELLEAAMSRNERLSEVDLGALCDSLSLLSTRLLQFVQTAGDASPARPPGETPPSSQRLRVYEDLRRDDAA
jgi:biopolymer transport protein ExbB/TolQ